MPADPKTYRWYTSDEFMALFATWPGGFLVKDLSDNVFSARLAVDGSGCYVYTQTPEVNHINFKEYQYSHDGGKTWHPFGVEE